MKILVSSICICLIGNLVAQETETYKSLDYSVGIHLQTPNSIGLYGTWERDNSTYLYADFAVTLEKYEYYDNISYYTASNSFNDRELDDYPSAISLNIGYVFNDDIEKVRPFVYTGINGGNRHVGFNDAYGILGNSGTYSVELPNSGYTKLNAGVGLMIPITDGEIKISTDANPLSIHVGIGLVSWSKARR